MFPTIPQSIAFRVRSAAELLCLPRLLAEHGAAKLQELPTAPWQALAPLCCGCGEREAGAGGRCWYCTAVAAQSPHNYQPWPSRAILLTALTPLPLAAMFTAWQAQGELVVILDSRVHPEPDATVVAGQLAETLDVGQSLLLGLPARRIGRRLLELLAWLADQSLTAQIAVLPLSLRRSEDYSTGDLLALSDHHWRYFPPSRTYVKVFPTSRNLASLEYAAQQDLFLDGGQCRQLLGRAAELRKIMGDEKLGALEKCLHDNELNRGYQFNKLLSICTPPQTEALLALHLLELDQQRVKFWLELTHYVA